MRLAGIEDTVELLEKQLASKMSKMTLEEALTLVRAFNLYLTLMGIAETHHSVLVHSDCVHGGHYYAYIKPTLTDQWFKFDNERVTKEDIKRALEEQYGGEEELP
ncbi:Ubiquitin carboxyl-terminal hydrolase 13 [Camellia lanceoleosa]|uniref:Ubiquitin carboxyl-terminal hydrolase 13 n=1 Tax=Camellia lanceoleosa TaxID=1840588 RepID=A0ACC0GW10_9ERIC|nr:Ubiquitin carboxyl-terminal hydrolase 13 [Camellia lanceoleosa]